MENRIKCVQHWHHERILKRQNLGRAETDPAIIYKIPDLLPRIIQISLLAAEKVDIVIVVIISGDKIVYHSRQIR